MELRRKKLKSLLVVVAGVVSILLLAAWGATGHRIINSNVVAHLPQNMQLFINNVNFLSQHASDADNRKSGDSQRPYIAKESPRHFIDIDSYPEFATRSVPEDFSTIIGKYDSATVFNIGVLPWAIVWTFDSLTARLKRHDTLDALQSAADLGHYIGDAHQPLHNTKDYDGRSSIPGSSGIHSRYETTMINAYQNQLTIQADSVTYISNPIDFAFSMSYESNSYVDSIYAADIYARQTSGYSGSGSVPSTYTSALWEKTKDFTQLQFQRATVRYADFLYTAWVDAGLDNVTTIGPLASAAHNPSEFWLGQNFPNPFNPSTNISFGLTSPAHVTLSVFDIIGQRIATLTDRNLVAGQHTLKFDADRYGLANGIYFYRLELHDARSSRTLTKKMVLLK